MKVRLADRPGALAWIFLMPSVVYIIALVAVPFILAIGFALSDVTAGDPSFDWVGLRNFERDYRNRLRNYLENQLSELDTSETQDKQANFGL